MPNFKLLPLLLVIGTTSLVGPVYAGIDREQSQEFFEEAVDFLRDESYTKAVIQLRNALQQDPDNLAARIMLGEVLLREGQPEAAIKELEKAHTMGGDENLILVPLAQAYRAIGKFGHIITGFNADGKEPEVRGEILLMQADAYVQLDNLKLAEDAYLTASTILSVDPRPLLGMARIKLAKGKVKAGYKLLEQASGLAPDSFEVWSFKGILYRDFRQYDEALQAFDKALELRPASVKILTARAALWLDVGNVEKAREDLELASGLGPDTLETIYLRTLILFRDGKVEEAREALRASADQIREIREDVRSLLPETKLMLGVVAYFEGNYDEAIAHLRSFIGRFPGHAGAKRYLASALLSLHEYDEVIKVYRPSTKSPVPNDPIVLSIIAEAYRASGDHKQAEKYYETALKLSPNAAGIGIKLAMSRLEAGQAETAILQLQKLAERFPNFAEIQAQLARAYVKIGSIDKAVNTVDRLVLEHGDSPFVQNIAGTVYLAAGDIDAARNHIELAATMDPSLILPQLNLARLARVQGDVASAEIQYRTVLEQFPFNSQAGLELAELLLVADQPEEARDRIRKVLEMEPGLFKAHEMRIRSLFQSAAEKAKIEATVLETLAKFPEEPKAELVAARAYHALGSLEDARVHLRRAVEKAQFDADLLFSAANQQFGIGDYSGALWSLTKAQQASPDRAEVAVLRAAVLVQLKEYDKAAEVVDSAIQKHGSKASILTVKGDLNMAQSRGPEAVSSYRQAWEISPNARTMSTLFRALTVNREFASATELMDDWLAKNPNDVSARHLYAQMLVSQKEWARAAKVYESLQAHGVDDIVMLNNLAVSYQHLGDGRALSIAEAAYKMSPEDSSIIDTYGWILTETGQFQEGLALLREAYARASTEPSIRYHMGMALARLGRMREAAEEVEAALAYGVGFPAEAAARELLAEIKRQN